VDKGNENENAGIQILPCNFNILSLSVTIAISSKENKELGAVSHLSAVQLLLRDYLNTRRRRGVVMLGTRTVRNPIVASDDASSRRYVTDRMRHDRGSYSSMQRFGSSISGG
jgi:hypothetical protein